MGRFLFVVPPLHGHVNPTIAVGLELAGRGHDVAWCGYRPFLEGLLPEGAEILPVGGEVPPAIVEAVANRARALRGMEALKFFWEEFLVPLADAMIPGTDAAVRRYGPDVIVADQQTVAGAFVALRHGVPWATSATTSAELADRFAGMPKLREWADGCLVRVQLEHGEDPGVATAGRLRFSEHLVLAFTTPALAGAGDYPAHWVFVGPAFAGRRANAEEFPWEWFEAPGPHVLVSLGTVNAESGSRFYRVVAEALAGQPVRAVLCAPPGLAGTMPENVIVRRRVPQLEMLAHLDAVVCHAGHNTVAEALAHGLPLVVAPIRDDQPVVAEQVVRAGAGIRVRFARTGPAELRAAIAAVLGEPAYGEMARAVQASFSAAGGAVAASDRLEELLGG